MRLIDADALPITPVDITDLPKDGMALIVYSKENVDNAPTVEAERHGHWVKIETSKFYDCQNTVPIYKCSFCHTPFVSVDLKDRYHYCPNCGALMDLVDQESEK